VAYRRSNPKSKIAPEGPPNDVFLEEFYNIIGASGEFRKLDINQTKLLSHIAEEARRKHPIESIQADIKIMGRPWARKMKYIQ
jgi:hypothetical protein